MWVNREKYESLLRQVANASSAALIEVKKPVLVPRVFTVTIEGGDEIDVKAVSVTKPGTYSGFHGYSVVDDYTFLDANGGLVANFPKHIVKFVMSEDAR